MPLAIINSVLQWLNKALPWGMLALGLVLLIWDIQQYLPPWLLWLVPWALLAVGFFLLIWGGHQLVTGAVTIAKQLGVPVLLIGLTIVAAGTSAPELFFNLFAVINGYGEMCFGNVVGSNIANIGLVLGICALSKPLVVHSRVLEKELPWLVCTSLGMVALGMPFLSKMIPGSPKAGFGFIDGIIFVIFFFIVTWFWVRQGKRDSRDPLLQEARETAESETLKTLWGASLVFLLGLGTLLLGGHIAKDGAVEVARQIGMSQALIGLTIVAFATSLPEVVTSWIAVRKGQTDLAVGNIVGSNLFNILLVLGATSICAPVQVPEFWGWWDLGAMLAMTIIMIPIAQSGQHITRQEGGLLVFLYLVYMSFSVFREYEADLFADWFSF